MLLNFNHNLVLFIIITYLKYTAKRSYDDNEADETK